MLGNLTHSLLDAIEHHADSKRLCESHVKEDLTAFLLSYFHAEFSVTYT